MKKFLAILFCVAISGGAFTLPALASPYTAEHDPPLLNRPDRPLRDEDILVAYLALLLFVVPSVSFFLYCLITAKTEQKRAQKEKEEQLRKKQSSTPSPSKQDAPPPPKPVIILQPLPVTDSTTLTNLFYPPLNGWVPTVLQMLRSLLRTVALYSISSLRKRKNIYSGT